MSAELPNAEVTAHPTREWIRLLTIPVAFLVVVAAPVAVVLAGSLAICDPARRRRWIAMALIALLVVVVVYIPLMLFTEPRLGSFTARPS